jgi:hypothetical protein
MGNDCKHVLRQLSLWGVISVMQHGEGRATRREQAIKQLAPEPAQPVSVGNHNPAHATGEHLVHQASEPAALEVEP